MGTGTFYVANCVVWDASDRRDNVLSHQGRGRDGIEAPMVILPIKSSLSFNGGGAKRHAQGSPATGARVLGRGHHNAARKTMLSGKKPCVMC